MIHPKNGNKKRLNKRKNKTILFLFFFIYFPSFYFSFPPFILFTSRKHLACVFSITIVSQALEEEQPILTRIDTEQKMIYLKSGNETCRSERKTNSADKTFFIFIFYFLITIVAQVPEEKQQIPTRTDTEYKMIHPKSGNKNCRSERKTIFADKTFFPPFS